ncbi:hypothetical protein QBC38DRAFT_450400 [Podospora fimiseda]|uniref:Uncharacterized protein n=1 Tax=Podospora fimiseda TaxID=252190 RepID=A0AAN7BZK9_9PEZI|nr:hypothetical protein QBC38DRAFT_450400 [Podospora fimiseda]
MLEFTVVVPYYTWLALLRTFGPQWRVPCLTFSFGRTRLISFGRRFEKECGAEPTTTLTPVFKFNPAEIHRQATAALVRWMAANRTHLIYLEVAILETLQWLEMLRLDLSCYETNPRTDGPSSFAARPIRLLRWLKTAHLYEAFHQVHKLAFYFHPYRFVNAVWDFQFTPATLATLKLNDPGTTSRKSAVVRGSRSGV